MNELLFFAVNGAFLGTHIHHHADLLLADGLLLGVGVNAKQAEDGIGGSGQEPHNRGKQLGDGGDQAGDSQRQRLCLTHGHPFGNQLTKDQGKVGQNQRDDDHGDGVQGSSGNAHTQAYQPIDQAV